MTPLLLPVIDPPPSAFATVAYTLSFTAWGGIPIYDWDIVAGTLPPGLALDRFTGTISGIPTTEGTFNVTLRVRDYHEGTDGISRSFPITVRPPPPVQLTLSLDGQGTNSQATLLLSGTAGQQQIIQVSSNFSTWISLVTNLSGTNLFKYIDDNILVAQRFYRAVVVQ